tara:strand:+ start:553 stop:849 length:297 start_codon:yes stop_codon:yes gene_type:complete
MVVIQYLDQLQVQVVVVVVIILLLVPLADLQAVMAEPKQPQLRQVLLGKAMQVVLVQLLVVQTVLAMLVVEVVQEPLVLMVLVAQTLPEQEEQVLVPA